MNVRPALYALLCLGTALLAGCNSGNGVGALPINTTVRVVNLIPNTPSITVTLDTTTPLISGLGFEQQTQYLDVTSGSHEFTVSADGGSSTILDVTQTLTNGQNFTLVVYGTAEAANAQFETDSPISFTQDGTSVTIPNGGTFAIRVANVAQSVGAIDVYLTSPGADLALTAPTIASAAYAVTTLYVPVTTGSYELRITIAGTKNVIYDTSVITFGDRTIVQAIVYGKGSGKLVDVDLLNLDTQGTGTFYQSLLAQFKVLNASSVGSPINIFVDGALTLTNVPLAGVSNYVKTHTGSETLSVESSANPGASLLTFMANFSAATDSSIVISGAAGALQALVLTDNNMPSPVGHARVRFVNASPDIASVDVYVNFALTFSGIVSDSASPYTEVAALSTGTVFNFGFNISGTSTSVLIVPNIKLAAGNTYTVYVVGPGNALQGVVVSDN
jgi:hypothetical protein